MLTPRVPIRSVLDILWYVDGNSSNLCLCLCLCLCFWVLVPILGAFSFDVGVAVYISASYLASSHLFLSCLVFYFYFFFVALRSISPFVRAWPEILCFFTLRRLPCSFHKFGVSRAGERKGSPHVQVRFRLQDSRIGPKYS